jgi:hypothetical protein
MNNKLTLSFKIPSAMHRELLEKVISDGYGMRGKSKWITEAIDMFLKFSNFPELVDIASDTEQLTDMLSVRIPKEFIRKIDDAIIEVRKLYPMIEGVKSNIIRASIYQRLIH